MSYFYLIRFRIRKIDFSYFNANLVKVSDKANDLHEKSHCSLCGGAMAELVFPDYFYIARFYIQRLADVYSNYMLFFKLKYIALPISSMTLL